MRATSTPTRRLNFLKYLLPLLLGAPTPAAAQPAVARDWAKYPAVVTIDHRPDVYAVGVVHGDYACLTTLLANCKVIPAAPADPAAVEWAAGKAVLVCTGDMIDKGPDGVKVLLLMKALQASAAKAGGRVVVLYGNHEAEFLGNKDFVKGSEFGRSLDRYADGHGLTGKLTAETVVGATDPLGLGAFLNSLAFGVVVTDSFFVHAGDTRKRTVKQLEDDVRQWVNAKGYDPRADSTDNESQTNPLTGLLEARLNKDARKHEQHWWRQTTKEKMAEYTKNLGVRRVVIGHQPGKIVLADGAVREEGEMTHKLGGRLWFIDVGMSSAVTPDQNPLFSRAAMLKITDGGNQLFRLGHDGKATLLAAQMALDE